MCLFKTGMGWDGQYDRGWCNFFVLIRLPCSWSSFSCSILMTPKIFKHFLALPNLSNISTGNCNQTWRFLQMYFRVVCTKDKALPTTYKNPVLQYIVCYALWVKYHFTPPCWIMSQIPAQYQTQENEPWKENI